jgi:hypothetical protein
MRKRPRIRKCEAVSVSGQARAPGDFRGRGQRAYDPLEPVELEV